VNAYDSLAPVFNRRRKLPDGVPVRVRDVVRGAVAAADPSILDLGAGAGRFAGPFLAAADRYVAVDLSQGMLRELRSGFAGARLIRADAARLPFADGSFDIVLLMQVLSHLHNWRRALIDVLRSVTPGGVLAVGRVVAPENGVDHAMKTRLADILATMDCFPYRDRPRDDALAWLGRRLPNHTMHVAASWRACRAPGAFLERHVGGVRFSALPAHIRADAVRQLTDWALTEYGALDHAEPEEHRFELTIFRNVKESGT